MKKISLFILAFTMMISMAFVMNLAPITAHATESSVWDGTTITQPTSMKTIDGVYYCEISTAEELAYIAKTGGDWLRYNYILANDITLNSVELTYDANGNITADTANLIKWTAIGKLTGNFNGQNHKISGLYGDGLFEEVEGTISNLTLDNIFVHRTSSNTGGICNKISGKIENCNVSGCVRGTFNVGGICGSENQDSRINNCKNYALVIATGDQVGGIIGNSPETACVNCENHGNINGYNIVGGIAGSIDWTHANNCINNALVQGNNKVGGIVGYGSVYNSKNSGNVIGNDTTGGIAGSARYIENCTNTGSVGGNDYVGGIGGQSAGWYTEIINCINIGAIHGNNYIGGIIGKLVAEQRHQSDESCVNNINAGDVSGVNYIGGIAGYSEYTVIKYCYMYGVINGDSKVGGVVGHNLSIWGKGTVTDCYYLKTSSVNTNLVAFGNTSEDIDGATSKDDSFFCINSDKTLNINGHSYSSTVLCDATCDNCGYERTVTHTFDNVKYDSDKHWYECDCGEVKPDSEESHTGGTATCTSKATCAICKQAYGDLNANNHTADTNWTSTNGQHYHTCTNGCDAKLDIADCSGGTATCQEKATCAICKRTYGAFAEHNFDETSWGCKNADGHAHVCQTSGCSEHDTVVAHTSSGAATEDVAETCTECGYIISPALGHKLSGGAIAGIAVGSTAVVGIGGFSLIWFVIKKKSWADLIAIFKKK